MSDLQLTTVNTCFPYEPSNSQGTLGLSLHLLEISLDPAFVHPEPPSPVSQLRPQSQAPTRDPRAVAQFQG